MVKTFTLIGSPGFERDEADLRELARTAFDRGRNPAAGAPPARRDHRLRRPHEAPARASRRPTLVIHGSADKLVRPSGGRATAKAIDGAELLEIPGMGHDLPRGAWPQIIDAIVANAARA